MIPLVKSDHHSKGLMVFVFYVPSTLDGIYHSVIQCSSPPALCSRYSYRLYFTACVPAKSLQSCLILCNPVDSNLPLLCLWNSPGKRTGVGCHDLLQEILPTQGSNPGLLHCRWILYNLSQQGSPYEKGSYSRARPETAE